MTERIQPHETQQLLSPDARPLSDTSLDMIDLDAVARHLAICAKQPRFSEKVPTDPLAYLVHRHCIYAQEPEAWRVSAAGVLCFGKIPQMLFQGSFVNWVRYSGDLAITTDVADLQKIEGTIFDQIAAIERGFRDRMRLPSTIKQSWRRVTREEYPSLVLRELTINMLGHRDYFSTQPSRIQWFRDRMVLFNAGGVQEHMNPEKLLRIHKPRNPAIFEILRDQGLIEGIGQGLSTIAATLAQEEMAPAEFDISDSAHFQVTIRGRIDIEDITQIPGINTRQMQLLKLARERYPQPIAPTDIRALFPDIGARSLQRDMNILVEKQLVRSSGRAQTQRYVYILPGDNP